MALDTIWDSRFSAMDAVPQVEKETSWLKYSCLFVLIGVGLGLFVLIGKRKHVPDYRVG